MFDVAGAAVDNGADLALAMPYRCRHAAEIGNLIDALHDQDIARFGKVMRLDLTETGNTCFDLVRDRRVRRDITDGERAPDDTRFRIVRAQHRRRHSADDAQLIHRIRHDPGEIVQCAIAVAYVF
jgi:hypothetical protein